MRMKRKLSTRFAAIALAVLSMAPILATADTVTVLGNGKNSCGSWLQNRVAVSWPLLIEQASVEGYITGFNNYATNQNGHISAGTDAEELFAWIDGYCRSHPL